MNKTRAQVRRENAESRPLSFRDAWIPGSGQGEYASQF